MEAIASIRTLVPRIMDSVLGPKCANRLDKYQAFRYEAVRGYSKVATGQNSCATFRISKFQWKEV